MLTADEILKLVNERLTVVATGRTPEGLYEPIRYVLSLGGKRIRPTLMLLAYNLFCEDPERILTPACALETYHNYTLLHDDLMDNADKRRGKPTVHVQWNDNQAILSGDTMLVLSDDGGESGRKAETRARPLHGDGAGDRRRSAVGHGV